MQSAVLAIVNPSVCSSVCPSHVLAKYSTVNIYSILCVVCGMSDSGTSRPSNWPTCAAVRPRPVTRPLFWPNDQYLSLQKLSITHTCCSNMQ